VNRDTRMIGLTVDDIASLWQVSKGTVYRYAHTHHWRRYTQAGRVHYHPADVTATFERKIGPAA
jgi:helix-turn-helix protein